MVQSFIQEPEDIKKLDDSELGFEITHWQELANDLDFQIKSAGTLKRLKHGPYRKPDLATLKKKRERALQKLSSLRSEQNRRISIQRSRQSESCTKSQNAQSKSCMGWKVFRAIAFTPIAIIPLSIFVWVFLSFFATVAPAWGAARILEVATSYDDQHPDVFPFLIAVDFLLIAGLQFIRMDMESCYYVSENISEKDGLNHNDIKECKERKSLCHISK